MKITFDQHGISMPDVRAPSFAKESVDARRDVHISNQIVFDWLRATLYQIPKEQRPEVTWIIYGLETAMDDDLRGTYWPPETDLANRPLKILLGWTTYDEQQQKTE